MAAELRLNVALDLAYFRQQLPKLSQAAAGFSLPIRVKFDARQIRLELNKIAGKDFRININDTAIKTARTNTQKLKNSLDLLQKQAYQVKIKYVEEGKPGNLPAARGGARTTGGAIRSLNAAQTRSLYEAALSKGLVKDIARTNAKELQAELIRGLSEAGQQGIAGLVKGIEGGKGAMKGVAAEVGNDFIASLKQVWQIASPSKKTEKIGEQLGEGLEIGVANSFGDASDTAVRKMREMFNRLKGEAKAGTAGLSALMMGMMGGIVPMGAPRGARGSIGPMIRQQRTAVQGQRQAQAGGLSALMMGMMGGIIPMGAPRGARGSIGPLIRQQRAAFQSRQQAQAASQVTPSFLAALPLLMGMRQDELTSRLQGLYGQQYQAPAMGGRVQPRPGRIANILSALSGAGSGVGTGGALSGQLFSGGLVNPGIASSGYIGRSALSSRYVNYPPGMPAAYGSGFMGGGGGSFSMGGNNQLALPSAEMRQAAQDLRFAARALQAQARGGSTGSFFGAPPPGGGRGPQPMLGPGGPPGGGGFNGRIPMSGFGGPNGAFGRNLLSGQAGIIGEIANEFGEATKQVLLFGTAYKALAAITSFPAQVANAVGKLQSFNNQLDAVTGGGETAQRSIALIESTVAKMNIPLDSARQGFVKLYASMRPAGIDEGTINNIFTGVASAAATFGMSSDQVDRMTNSLAQMASKGQIMAEELKGQLGDVFPQAVSLFAKAAGYLDESMTDVEKSEGIAKFLKAMEDGTFKGKAMQQMLKNVGILLNQDFGPSAVKAGESFNNQLNKLNNALQKFYEAFAPAAGAFLGEFVTPITNGLKVVSDAAKLALSGDALGGNQLAAYFRNELFPQLVNVKDGLLTAAKTVAEFAGALGVVLRPLAQFVLGNKELVTVVARAVTIFALYKTSMAAATAVGLIPLIRSIVNYNQVFRIFVAQSAQGATTLGALRVAAAQTGTSMASATAGVRALGTAIRTVLVTSIVGFALVAISMLIERIQALQAAADRVRNIKPTTVSRLRGAAQAGGTTGLQSEQRTVQAELQRKERMAANLRTLQSGGTVSPAAIDELEAQGLNIRGMTFQTPGGRVAPQYTMRGAPGMEEAVVNPELSRIANQVTAEAQAARQGYQTGMGLAGRDAAVVDARTAAQSGIQVGDLVGGDGGGGKDKKERESQIPILQERLNLARDIAKIEAQIGQAQILQQDFEVMRLETEKELRQIKFEIAEVMLDKETPAAEQQLKIAELQVREEQTRKKLRDEIQKKIITDLIKHKDALDDIKSKSEDELRNRQRYAELLAKGLRPEQAKLTIEVENQFRELEKVLKLERERLRIQVDILKAKKAAGEKIDEGMLRDLEDALKKYDERIGQLPSEGKAELDRRTEADKPLDRATRLREIMREAEAELEKLIDPVNLLVGAAETFRDAFAGAFADLITGAVSAQQALANVFKSIGDYFAQMAGRMIAQWLFMKAIGLVANIFGANVGGGGGSTGPVPIPGSVSELAANGALWRGGFTPFADGGMVTGPTLGLVGEGRFNEAVVPLPNGKSIPVDLGNGAGNNIATNITVNVNNGQAQSNMSGTGGAALAKQLDSAVKDVILRETRPGGIIYSAR